MTSTPHSYERTQTWNAETYRANGRFVADLAGEVLAWLAPQPGERILDLGCGDGALTQTIAAAGASVVGCDADESMLAAANARGLLTARADMRELPFRGEFDAVFSNAALHWVLQQDLVLRGVHSALRPGGRFVAEMGGHGNIAAIRTALRAVLASHGVDSEAEAASFFPSVDEYVALLQTNGFRVVSIALAPRPTLLKAGMEAWLLTFRSGVLQRLSAERRADAVAETVQLLRPVLCDHNGQWWADYVRLRLHAVRD